MQCCKSLRGVPSAVNLNLASSCGRLLLGARACWLTVVHFPDSYDDIRSIFGMHLDWILFIILLGAICWGYIKYIRPQLHQHDEVRMWDAPPSLGHS